MILLHDNARPYVAKIVKDTLSALQWEITIRRVFTRLCFLSLFRSMARPYWRNFKTYEEIKKKMTQ